jgi:hypothetical protein
MNVMLFQESLPFEGNVNSKRTVHSAVTRRKVQLRGASGQTDSGDQTSGCILPAGSRRNQTAGMFGSAGDRTETLIKFRGVVEVGRLKGCARRQMGVIPVIPALPSACIGFLSSCLTAHLTPIDVSILTAIWPFGHGIHRRCRIRRRGGVAYAERVVSSLMHFLVPYDCGISDRRAGYLQSRD